MIEGSGASMMLREGDAEKLNSQLQRLLCEEKILEFKTAKYKKETATNKIEIASVKASLDHLGYAYLGSSLTLSKERVEGVGERNFSTNGKLEEVLIYEFSTVMILPFHLCYACFIVSLAILISINRLDTNQKRVMFHMGLHRRVKPEASQWMID